MEMRWCQSTPGSAEYILPVTLSTPVTPVSPYNRRRSFKMYLIEHVWDALGDGDQVNSEMHLEARIVRVWRCTWRPWLCELAGRSRASLEIHLEAEINWKQKMHLQAVIDRVWRCTLKLWPSEFGDALAGCDRARLEEYLQAVDLAGGVTAAETLSIG